VTAVMLTGLGPGTVSAATRVSWTVLQLPSPGGRHTKRNFRLPPRGLPMWSVCGDRRVAGRRALWTV